MRIQVCHPHTRTYVRLLGPCFKTGRLKPLKTASQNGGRNIPRTCESTPQPKGKEQSEAIKQAKMTLPSSNNISSKQLMLTKTQRSNRIMPTPPHSKPNGQAAEGLTRNGSTPRKQRFQSLPFQQFQALLTLISKSFSSFLHSTCSLSVSRQYLALCETYHTFCAQIPMNATQ